MDRRLVAACLCSFPLATCALTGFAQSSRPGWGAAPYAGAGGTGVTFRTWAPTATSVHVAGSFNGWSATAHPLVKETSTGGVWSLDVSSARVSNNYKFVIDGSLWRTDPHSRLINPSDNNNSVICGTNTFSWNGDAFSITNSRDVVIYEAHVGTFGSSSGTFSTFTNKLDYLRDLGISTVELMPVNEFPSATSWGYNPAYPFAVETNYGPPDALKALVKSSHAHGIGLFLDVVHNHWDGGSSLWQYDGWSLSPGSGGVFFFNSEPYASTWWGPRPDYGRPEVRQFIENSFRMWLDEYRLDGFRWDAPKYILYTTNDVYIPDGALMVTNALKMMASDYPGTWNIAEDIKEVSGFDSFWDLGFVYEIRSVLTQSDDDNRDMPTVARNVAGTSGRVIYTDSHDTAGDLNGGTRLPAAIYAAQAEGYYARKRSTLGAALIMTSPGTPMILQGQEMLETNQFGDARAVDWSRTNTFAGIVRLYRDLIRLRRNLDGVSPGLCGDACNTYLVDNVNKLVAYHRSANGSTGAYTVVVANFANAPRSGYSVGFPEEGTWYVHFNSDSTNYAADYGGFGSAEVVATGSPPFAPVSVGPYSALILSKTPRTGMLLQSLDVDDQPAGNGDGIPDPGETVRERIVLWNKSQTSATNVSATISCGQAGVALLQAAAAYPAMTADGVATNGVAFEYRLSNDLACGTLLEFEMAVTFNGLTVTGSFSHAVGALAYEPAATNLFDSIDVPKPIPDRQTTYSDLTVNETGDHSIKDVDVLLRINHTYDYDLILALRHPDGTEVLLSNHRGGSGDNYGTGACGSGAYTVFDQGAAAAITSGNAPFAGSYRPEGNLGALNGKSLNGTWRLRMTDSYRTDIGTGLCWSIRAIYERQAYDCHCFSNRAPTALATSVFAVGYSATNIQLSGSDPDGQSLTFQTVAAPSHGLLSALNTATWETAYLPIHGFVGTDTFQFIANDGLTDSPPAGVDVVVTAPQDTDGDGMPDAWEQAYFSNPTSGSATADLDNDGFLNFEEYGANTSPADSNSLLRLSASAGVAGAFTVQWPAVGGSRYRVEFNPGFDTAFSNVSRSAAVEIAPAPKDSVSSMTFTDDFTQTPPLGAAPSRLYRVRIVGE